MEKKGWGRRAKIKHYQLGIQGEAREIFKCKMTPSEGDKRVLGLASTPWQSWTPPILEKFQKKEGGREPGTGYQKNLQTSGDGGK